MPHGERGRSLYKQYRHIRSIDMSYDTFLGAYSTGPDCYERIGDITGAYGRKAVIIGGKTALSKAEPEIRKCASASGIEITGTLWYGGDATYSNAKRLEESPEVQSADMVFAVGGGRAVDTCKVVSDNTKKPLFTFPTLASNCAAVTAIAVIYKDDGSLEGYFYPERCPVHSFINTKVIADSPRDMFWAGIGDALSKEYEVLLASRGEKLSHTPLMGAALSRSCTEPLIDFGAAALRQCERGEAGVELQEVVLDIIISTGIVSNMTNKYGEYYYNSSLAHAFYNGSTVIDAARRHLHGEIVSFGVLVLLTYDGQIEERDRIMRFNKSIGLPVTLAEMDIRDEDLKAIADKAETVLEWEKVPYKMSKERFIEVIRETSRAGEAMDMEKEAV